jgi:NitT/TauT family transport system permease protein
LRAPRWRSVLVGLIALAAILLVWHVAASIVAGSGSSVAAMMLPHPAEVGASLVNDAALIAEAAWATMRGALIGLLVGTAVGFAIGVLMAQARWIEDASYPYIVAAQMIPTVALAPIVLGAVRDPEVTKVIVAAYLAVFPVSLGVIKGLKSTSPQALELMRTYHSGRWQQFRKLRLPASLPFFFAGLKVAAPLAVIGEIVVELAGSKDGLGTLLLTTQYYGGARYAYLFWATLLVTLSLGLLFAAAAALLERIAAPWQPEFRQR